MIVSLGFTFLFRGNLFHLGDVRVCSLQIFDDDRLRKTSGSDIGDDVRLVSLGSLDDCLHFSDSSYLDSKVFVSVNTDGCAVVQTACRQLFLGDDPLWTSSPSMAMVLLMNLPRLAISTVSGSFPPSSSSRFRLKRLGGRACQGSASRPSQKPFRNKRKFRH